MERSKVEERSKLGQSKLGQATDKGGVDYRRSKIGSLKSVLKGFGYLECSVKEAIFHDICFKPLCYPTIACIISRI